MQTARGKKLVLAAVLLVMGGSARWGVAQGPVDFLRRADENGNGMLDPNELEGRMGGFIRRMAENNPRLDLSRPIPIDRLASEFERAREERMRSGGGGPPSGGGGPSFGGGPPFGGGFSPYGGGPPFGGGFSPFGGGPPFGGDGRGRDSGRGGPGGNESSPYSERVTKVQPLVPGFGVPNASTPPPGFGAEGQLFTINITEEDRREAERSFRYYDRNQDGKIDAEEMGRSRYGSDLPMYDRNRDGVITMNEMEYRYARRRMENTQDNRSRSGPPSGDRREDDRRRDRSRDGDGGGGEQAATATDSAERKSYRRKPPIERLPEGIPDWFPRDDGDGDGQIAMNEFSASWTDGVLAEFNQFDLNRDGLITPSECMAAKNNGAVRGGSIGPASSSTPAPATTSAPAAGPATSDPAASAATPPAPTGASPVKVDPRYYDYFKKVVIKYDANNDGELTPNEWSSMSKNPEAADTDRNGRITIEEYAIWQTQR